MRVTPRLFLLATVLVGACEAPVRPAPALQPASVAAKEEPPPAVVSPVDLEAEAAADRLRDAILRLDPHECVAEAEAVLRGPAASARLRAWAIFCVAEAQQDARAEAALKLMRQALPDDPWTEFAAVGVGVAENQLEDPTLVTRSAALMKLLADHPDTWIVRARALQRHQLNDEVIALAGLHPESGVLRAARVRALYGLAGKDEAGRAEAFAAAQALTGVAAIAAAETVARWARGGPRHLEALAMIEAALIQSPRSVVLHGARFTLLWDQPGRSEAERRAAVSAAMDELLEVRGSTPKALFTVMREAITIDDWDRHGRLSVRLLADFPGDPATEEMEMLDMLAAHYASEPPRGEALAELRRDFAEFLARPGLNSAIYREWIARALFESLRDDPKTTPEALLAAVDGMLAGRVHSLSTYGRAARALLERTNDVERAEAIAREGMLAVEALAAAKTAAGMPAAASEAERASELAELSDALGAALVAQDRLVEAAVALEAANLLAPGVPRYIARLAALVDRQGGHRTARAKLLECREIAIAGGRHPCEVELEAIYRAEHGSLRGYAREVARWAAVRRAELRGAGGTAGTGL